MMVMGVMSLIESNGMFLYRLGLTTWLLLTMPMVLPSLGARTNCAVPVMPPAPGKFSITRLWPSTLPMLGPIARMAPSAPEPADSGRMTRSGLSCGAAKAVGQVLLAASALAVASHWRRVRDGVAALRGIFVSKIVVGARF